MIIAASLAALSLGQASAMSPERLRQCDATVGAVGAIARYDGQDDVSAIWEDVGLRVLRLRLNALGVGRRQVAPRDIMTVSNQRADEAYVRVRQILSAETPEDGALRRRELEAEAQACAAELSARSPE